jgi:transposase
MPHLTDHSLRQLDAEYVQSLERLALCDLSVRLLEDLKEARERLSQDPSNSSRPPSSRAPWERLQTTFEAEEDAAQEDEQAAKQAPGTEPASRTPDEAAASVDGTAAGAVAGTASPAPATGTPPRKPGKQPGAPGVGRTQVLAANDTQIHRPSVCAGCGKHLIETDTAVVFTGFQSVDLRWGEADKPGLWLWVVNHRYVEVTCGCGHQTRAVPGQGEVDAALTGARLSEWRLVGPGLVSLIVALHLRFRMSRARMHEFLREWLGRPLSIGTLHQTLQEAAAALAPAEQELIQSVQTSGLLHADETAWPQQDQEHLLWLWVFISQTVVYYTIAGRGKKTVLCVLAGFGGWLMSDGWFSYRGYGQRLRCWAHLQRKAKGLMEGFHPEGRLFGRQVHDTLEQLMAAVYAAREGPASGTAPVDLPREHATLIEALRLACTQRLGHAHGKTRALAVEFYTDWDAIFQVLKHPELPLTNNEAERALRHWVISRNLSHGTRTSVGSRVFTLLASVIDTCRLRGHSPWRYITTAITDRRAGRPLAALPQVGV